MNDCAVITGMGVLTAIGNNTKQFWESLAQGKSGVGEIKGFDITPFRSKIGCEIKGFEPEKYILKRRLKRMDRASILALVAAQEAMKDAGIDVNSYTKRVGIILGTTLSGMISAQKYYRDLLLIRDDRARASKLREYPIYAAGTHIIDHFGLEAEQMTISTACSSSLHAIGIGADLLKAGRCDLVIVGGYDPMAELTYTGFELLRAMSGQPTKPFDLNRTGLNLGEGAGILVMERKEDALKRGVEIHAEVAGYGSSSDAYHMTAPHKDAEGILRAMGMALKEAKLNLEDIDYINAHGTGTKHNDAAESLGIKKFFKEYAYQIPVSSTKSMIGHTLGAAGSIETIAGILAMKNNLVPPTINYETPDPECDLDFVPNQAREKEIHTFMNNSFGFGGNNGILIIKEVV